MGFVQLLPHRRHVLGMDDVEQPPLTENLPARIERADEPGGVEEADAVGGVIDDGAEAALARPQRLLALLALDGVRDLGGDEGEQFEMRRLVTDGRRVALGREHADGPVLRLERNADPGIAGSAHLPHLARPHQLLEARLVHGQGLAGAEDVLRQASLEVGRHAGQFVVLVHRVGEVEDAPRLVVEGDVEVRHRHQVGNDPVHFAEQLLQRSGAARGLRDAVQCGAEALVALALGDVAGDGEEELPLADREDARGE